MRRHSHTHIFTRQGSNIHSAYSIPGETTSLYDPLSVYYTASQMENSTRSTSESIQLLYGKNERKIYLSEDMLSFKLLFNTFQPKNSMTSAPNGNTVTKSHIEAMMHIL